jgi:hypothetical protein
MANSLAARRAVVSVRRHSLNANSIHRVLSSLRKSRQNVSYRLILQYISNAAVTPVALPHAVARPSSNAELFARQGSLRMPLANTEPFKRQYSLRVGECENLYSYSFMNRHHHHNANADNEYKHRACTGAVCDGRRRWWRDKQSD